MDRKPICRRCGLFAYQIEEFKEAGALFGITPDQYVVTHETTFDPRTMRFYCTDCFQKAGFPLAHVQARLR